MKLHGPKLLDPDATVVAHAQHQQAPERRPDPLNDYAHFLRSFVAAHPMPKLTDPDESEIYGPLAFEDKQYFRKYDGRIEVWSIIPELDPAQPSRPANTNEDIDIDDAAALDALATFPPPAEPEEGAGNVFDGPFFHNGRRFAWCHVGDQDGWQLAIFERSDEP